MADVYGAQHWLARGVLPPALVQAHAGYLRALHAALPVGARYLHLVACDLACTPDGSWHVVGLGTQAPSGLAWLLHERLAPGFRGLRDTLLNPASDTNHLVLLTPGPYARAYGEHAALAQGLGLSLAQGCDLQVRRQRLVLNTLDGPVPVHGLIKMVDDAFIDPLELRADSTLGVPGLVQLLRSNSLVVANRPGCAFLENPALLAYLPALAQAVLGQALQLPVCRTGDGPELTATSAPAAHLRVFALAKPGGGWCVLPAGLLQPAGAPPAVVPPRPADRPRPLFARRQLVVRRAGENLFWLGRYHARAVHTAHVAQLTLQLLEHPGTTAQRAWLDRLARLHGSLPTSPTPPAGLLAARADPWDGPSLPDSLVYNLRAVQLAAAQVRERLPQESLAHIDQLASLDAAATGALTPAQLQATLDTLAALQLHPTPAAPHDAAWQLMAVGQRLERLGFLAQTLQLAVECDSLPPAASGYGLAVLFAPPGDQVDGNAPYLHDRSALLHALVRDPQRPHSLAQVAQDLRNHWQRLQGVPSDAWGPPGLDGLPDPARWPGTDRLAARDQPGGSATALTLLLQQCQQAAAQLGQTLETRYFDAPGNAHVID